MSSTATTPPPQPAPTGHAAGGVVLIDLSDNPDVLDLIYKEAMHRRIPAGQVVREMFNAGVSSLTEALSNPEALN